MIEQHLAAPKRIDTWTELAYMWHRITHGTDTGGLKQLAGKLNNLYVLALSGLYIGRLPSNWMPSSWSVVWGFM